MVYAGLVLLATVAIVSGLDIEDPNVVLSSIIKDLQNAPEGDAGDAINNRACDGLLGHINNEILNQKRSIIPLPDISETVRQSVTGLTLKGKVFATKGRAGNLATLKRLSGTTVRKSNGGKKIEVAVIVGLGSLSIQYQDYNSDLSGAKHKGRIDFYVGKHSALFKVQVDIHPNNGCTIVLQVFKIKELENLTIIIDPPNPYLSTYLQWYMDNKKAEKMAELEGLLLEQGRKALNHFKCNLNL